MTYEEKYARYESLSHAVQTGVRMTDELAGSQFERNPQTEMKHLRVGLNLRACDHAALAELMIAKGIITRDEYIDSLLKFVEQEVQMYETNLARKLGKKVTLA